MGLHIGLAVSVMAAALLRRWLPFDLRAGYLVAFFFIIGLGSLFTLGIMVGPQLFFVAAGILAFCLFGAAAGFAVVGLGVAAMLATYMALAAGMLPTVPDPIAYLVSAGGWITAATGLVLTATVIGISLVGIFRSMSGATDRAHRQNMALQAEIAERHRADAARRDQETRAQAIVDHAPAVIFIKDRDGRFLMVNRGFQEQYGLRAADTIGNTDTAVAPPALAALFRARDLEVMASGTPQELEHVDDSGGARRVYSTVRFPIRDRDGNIFGVCGIATDITQRKQAEAAAKESHASLRNAIDSVSQAIVLWDGDRRIAAFNQRFADFFHDVPAIGLHHEDFIRALVAKGLSGVAAGQEEAWIAARIEGFRRADGTPLIENLADGRKLSIVRTRSQDSGIVTVATDITEQIKSEERLRDMQKMEAIGKLTGGMAHDFNNYLAVIIGNLDLLMEDGDIANPETKLLLDQAIGGAMRAAELTRSLLAFSRNQPLEASSTDIGRRLSAVARLLDRTLGEHIVLNTDFASDLWSVKVDGPQLDSSVVNLANNARDAMPGGGTLTIAAHNTRLDAADARIDPEFTPGDYVLIEVSDTGTGMPPEVASRAFEPFFSTKGPGHWTGLGLSMVYGYVKQSGGHVAIDSKSGRGTTVRIYLPREEGQTAAASPAVTGRARALPPGGREIILLAEDNAQMRRTTAAQLGSLGYQVVEAVDGNAALTFLQQADRPFDLLLTDIVMPGGIDGYQLAKLALERRPGIKVLLSSGYTGESLPTDKARDLGLKLLAKPYRQAELAKAVRTVLDAAP